MLPPPGGSVVYFNHMLSGHCLICSQSSWPSTWFQGGHAAPVLRLALLFGKCHFSFLALEEMTSPSLLFQMMINLLLCEFSCPCDHVLHHTVSFNPSYSSVCSMHSKFSTGSFYVLFPLCVGFFFFALVIPLFYCRKFSLPFRLGTSPGKASNIRFD